VACTPASLVLAQTDFEQIERNQREGRWDLVGDLLAEQGNKLKAAGTDFFLLACNTVHTAADRIVGAVDLPFLHIVDPTGREVQHRGVMTVGLLGSRYTMTGGYFVGRLREHYGINVLVAEGEHQENVPAERDWLRVVTGIDDCQQFEDTHGGQLTLIEAIADSHVLPVDQELSNTLADYRKKAAEKGQYKDRHGRYGDYPASCPAPPGESRPTTSSSMPAIARNAISSSNQHSRAFSDPDHMLNITHPLAPPTRVGVGIVESLEFDSAHPTMRFTATGS
jgi:hypothetical protein